MTPVLFWRVSTDETIDIKVGVIGVSEEFDDTNFFSVIVWWKRDGEKTVVFAKIDYLYNANSNEYLAAGNRLKLLACGEEEQEESDSTTQWDDREEQARGEGWESMRMMRKKVGRGDVKKGKENKRERDNSKL